ncbi:BglG family transcription antiterminator [Trichococcus flocculiformis]|uniref:BglG family transcription antiterminator n=1 Tax=Trichococcus flocculiformis TaxID=82803 RepID=UPI002AAAAC44|nr:PTS sugar transporter subunit IIA [Trichococcus flocculiformis]
MRDRSLELLRKFVISGFPVSIETLCEEFKLSQRTLRSEIKSLNDYLVENEFPIIETIRGKGFQLTLSKSQTIDLMGLFENDFKDEFYSRDERILDLVLDIALGQNKVFLYQKEEEYQISKSTLDEDMRRLRTLLKEYGVEVLSIPKQGLVFEAKERIIRTMLYSLVNKAIDNVALIDNIKNQSTIQQIIFKYIPLGMINEINQLYDHSISSSEENLYRKNRILFTAIWLARYNMGFYVKNTNWVRAPENAPNGLHVFVTAIFERFGLSPDKNEFNYLVFMLNTFNSKDMNNSVEWAQAQILSIQLIQYVENATKIPFSKKEEALQEGLYKHIGGLLNRLRYDTQFSNPMKDNIKSNYGEIYKAVEGFSKVMSTMLDKEITDDEVAFLTIHFSTSLSELNQEIEYCYRAVVICNHGVATGKLLAENLKELFNIEVLAVLSSRETDLINKLDVDLVFATVPISEVSKPLLVIDPIIKRESKEVIYSFLNQNSACKRLISRHENATQMFSSILSLMEKQDIKITKEIYGDVEEIFRENRLSINTKEIQPMIKDILKDTDIIIQAKASGWEDSIKLVSQPLLEDGTITDQYVTAMIDTVKEFGPYIVIGPHLALAHARPEEGANRLGLSVATLADPVSFGHEMNDPVKIIFCLSAIDSFSHLNIMKNLIDLINDEEKIDQLAEVKSEEEFKQLLFG